MDGDDRKEFLCGNTADLLYWWMLMDENDLIYIFVGKLDANNSASSDVTPAPTAGGNSTKSGSDAATSKKGKANELTREMVDNVAAFKKTVDIVASTDIRTQIDRLRDKAFALEGVILDEFDAIDMDMDSADDNAKKRYG